MASIPDFSDQELTIVRELLQERYKTEKEIQLADTELRLNPDSSTMTPCPTVYWEDRGCHFVVCKLGKQRYFCQFFYGNNEQFGTGREDYDDLLDCVTTLLRVQADHELKQA